MGVGLKEQYLLSTPFDRLGNRQQTECRFLQSSSGFAENQRVNLTGDYSARRLCAPGYVVTLLGLDRQGKLWNSLSFRYPKVSGQCEELGEQVLNHSSSFQCLEMPILATLQTPAEI